MKSLWLEAENCYVFPKYSVWCVCYTKCVIEQSTIRADNQLLVSYNLLHGVIRFPPFNHILFTKVHRTIQRNHEQVTNVSQHVFVIRMWVTLMSPLFITVHTWFNDVKLL